MLKKMVLLILVFLSCFTGLYSQVFIGGSFNVQIETNNPDFENARKSTYTSVDFSPKAGCYFQDNLVAGIGISYMYGKSDYSVVPGFFLEDESHLVTFFLFGRYYMELSNKISMFGDASIGIGLGHGRYGLTSSYLPNPDLTVYTLGLQPGISFSISKLTSIELLVGNIGYSYTNASYTQTGSYNSNKTETREENGYKLNISFNSIGIGLSFKL